LEERLQIEPEGMLLVSASTGTGLDKLLQRISEVLVSSRS
jgi:50S ribosomal subunit-associated GTPase HflX